MNDEAKRVTMVDRIGSAEALVAKAHAGIDEAFRRAGDAHARIEALGAAMDERLARIEAFIGMPTESQQRQPSESISRSVGSGRLKSPGASVEGAMLAALDRIETALRLQPLAAIVDSAGRMAGD